MIDVHALIRPIEELAQTFGTGDLASGGAHAQLLHAANQVQTAGDQTRDAVAQVAPHWTGGTALEAFSTAQGIQTASNSLHAQGGAMGVNLLDAATSVLTGVGELAQIGASFLGVLRNADTLLSHPIGQLTLLKAALDHLSPALGVVIRVSSDLSGHTSQMQALMGGDLAVPAAPGAPNGTSMNALTAGSSSQLPEFGSYELFSGSADLVTTGGVQVQLPDGSVATAPNEQAASAVRNALSQQGVPYSWGGTTPGAGFDCSGLTQWAYREAGVELPRLAHEQAVGAPVDPSNVQAGDLAVWSGHAAMVVGNGQMIEAGSPVEMSPIRTDNAGQQFLGFYRPTA